MTKSITKQTGEELAIKFLELSPEDLAFNNYELAVCRDFYEWLIKHNEVRPTRLERTLK